MTMKRILFVCIHNSARSQMAEAFVNHYCQGSYLAMSAGLEPGTLNPLVVVAMQELGIDILSQYTKSVEDILRDGIEFSHVVTVCDEANAERCPMFPGGGVRLHWGFADPSAIVGSDETRLARTREIRDEIRQRVAEWCAEMCPIDGQK